MLGGIGLHPKNQTPVPPVAPETGCHGEGPPHHLGSRGNPAGRSVSRGARESDANEVSGGIEEHPPLVRGGLMLGGLRTQFRSSGHRRFQIFDQRRLAGVR